MKRLSLALMLISLPVLADTLPTAQLMSIQLAQMQRLTSRLESLENSMIGVVQAFSGDTIPAGWVECDGRALDRSAYPKLFAIIGNKWNTFNGQSDPGAGKFRVPNLNGVYLRGAAAPAQYLPFTTAPGGLKLSNTLAGTVDITHDHGSHQHNSGINVAWQAGSDRNGMWHTDPNQVAGATCCGTDWQLRSWSTGGTNISLGSTNRNISGSVTTSISGDSETRPNSATVKYIVRY